MKHFLIALQFLTRIRLANQYEWVMEDFGKAVPYFTPVGIIIGLLSGALYLTLQPYMGNSLTALIIVVFHFLITGGLHADGFMDTCDGLFSGRDRQRKLEIMKDSRVGSNGVVGFVFLVLLKWQFLAYIPHVYVPSFLILLSSLSKQGLTMSVCRYPYARSEGMGKAFAQYAPQNSLTISYVFTMVALVITFLFMPKGAYILLILIVIFSFVFNNILNGYITKHLGGVTGDTYGFVSEVTELLLLLIFTLILEMHLQIFM